MPEDTGMPVRVRPDVSVPADVPVEWRAAQVSDVDFEKREITVIAVPYNETARVNYRGQPVEEHVEPGAFDGLDPTVQHITANREHAYERTFGKVSAADTKDERGLITTLKAAHTPLGDETLNLAAEGVLKASVGMLVKRSDQVIRSGARTIRRAYLDHVALVPNPAYAGAAVLGVRDPDSARISPEAQEPAVPTPKLDAILADPVVAAALEGRR